MNDRVPRVSIGLPVYNGQNYLGEAIDSLLAQTFEDFELIISDNGSTDHTEAICRAYAARDRRIRYYRQERNLGAAWNFNRVFALGHGEYFKWAAHDDLCSPTFLAHCVQVLDRHPAVVWCHTRTTHIDTSGRPLPAPEMHDISYAAPYAGSSASCRALLDGRKTCGPTRESPLPHQRFRAVLLGTGGSVDIFGLIRAEAMRKTSLYQPYYGADKVLVAELSLLGRFQEIPETLFFIRVHPDASGCIPSAAQQASFVNPCGPRRFAFTRLHLLAGHARAILRAELSAAERARCFAVLARYLLQVRKWKDVLTRMVTGAGTGGGYLPVLPTLDNQEARQAPGRGAADAAAAPAQPWQLDTPQPPCCGRETHVR